MHFHSWLAFVRLAVLLVLTVLAILGLPTAQAQQPPAGSVIGAQATAVYETPAGQQVTVQSNLVETRVNQVVAVDLEAAHDSIQAGGADDSLIGAKTASTAGGIVTFPHTVQNLGNGADAFDLGTAYGAGSAGLTNIQIYADADADGVADNLTAITATPTLAPGEVYGIVVQATVPAGLTAGEANDPITLTATSTASGPTVSNPGASDAVSDDITVQAGPVIIANKVITPDSGVSGDTLTVTLTYQNTGATAGVVRVSDPLPPEMTYVAGSATWSDGTGAALTEANDAAEQTSGAGDTINYRVDLASVLGVSDFDGASDRNTVLFEINDVPAGASGTVTFQATITAGTAPGIYANRVYSCDETTDGADCDPTNPGPAPTFEVDAALGLTFADSQSTADTPRAGAGLGDPYADPAGALGGALVSGTDAGADTDGDTANDVVADNGTNGNTTDPVTTNPAWAEGSDVPFSFILTNDGNATDVFNLTQRADTGLVAGGTDFPVGTSFRFETASGLAIADSDGNGDPDVTLGAGEAVEVVLIVDLPVGSTRAAADAAWQREVIAASKADPTLTNESVAQFTSAVVAASVDLQNISPSSGDIADAGVDRDGDTNDEADDDLTLDGSVSGDPFNVIATDPGTTVDFSLRIVNSTATVQSYDLQFSGSTPSGTPVGDTFNAGSGLPAGWQVEFRLGGTPVSNTGTIAAGGQVDVTARVTVPANASSGDQNLWFRAISPTTGAFDVKLDRVSVNAAVDLILTPDQAVQAAPGGTVILTHTLTNNGNVAITDGAISFSTAFPSFSGTLFVDTNDNGSFDGADVTVTSIADILTAIGDTALDPGESVILFNRVQTPAAAVAGLSEQAVITLASALTDASAAAVTDSNTANNAVTDTVTVIAGDLDVVKRQARDDDCDGAPETAFQLTQLTANPTQCLIYQITVTNTGSENALNVEIRDATPAFTSFEVVVSVSPSVAKAGSGAGAAAVSTQPAQGATGDVIATFGTLAPGDTATLTFSVEIDGNLPNTTGGASTPIQ